MKKLPVLILISCVAGCAQPPDFSKPCEVDSKETNSTVTVYKFKYGCGAFYGNGSGAVKFAAPEDLANVGDMVGFVNGSIAVVNPNPSAGNRL
ncbi:MAG: hypothetical protein V3V84_07740 [Candidatus Bathyarchaeia archaeon]